MKTYRYFWELIKFRPLYYTGDIVSISLHFAATTLIGLILRAYFNGLTGESDFALPLWPIIGLQLVVTAVIVASHAGAALAYINFQYHSMALMIRNMFARVLQMPGSHPLPVNPNGKPMTTGEAVSTFRDDTKKLLDALVIVDDLVGLLVSAAISFTVMFSISPLVTLATFLPLSIVIFVAERLGERAKMYRQQSREATSQVTSLIAGMFENTQAIKVANAEDRLIAHFKTINLRRQETMIKDQVFTKLVESLSNSTGDIGLGLILLSTAQMLLNGRLTIGDFALFAAYIWPTTFLMRIAGMMITRYKQSAVSTDRMEQMMQGAPPEEVVAHHPLYMRRPFPALSLIPHQAGDQLKTLTVRNLTYRFAESVHEAWLEEHEEAPRTAASGIEGINLTLRRGALTVITGRIGSGKTTLLKTLLGLHTPQNGDILWNEKRVEGPDTFMIPPRVAYAGQIARLFSLSLQQNMLMGLPETAVNLQQAIYTAVFDQDLAQMEHGLDTFVGPRGVRLSGGQVQRAAAARMFVRHAELYVLDDLSSALDVETEQTLWERVFAQKKGEATFLVVSHRKSVLQMADHIVVLKNGRIDAEGNLAEVRKASEEMRRLWDASAGG